MRELHVWIEDRKVGSLTEDPQPDGSSLYAFEYTELTTSDIVSLTMVPLDGELRFESRTFPPPFDMVLPEGERRGRIEDARKILRTDPFSLLSYVGANPVNRVMFLLPDEVPGTEPAALPAPEEIASSTAGRELFSELVAQLDLRQGIAGAQPKVLGKSPSKISAGLRQFRGSTHILKSSSGQFPYLAVNEKICLEIFASAGIQVPRTTLSADGELLLVERFDIREDGRLAGFEEAASLLGETSATKYLRDYGSLIDILCDFISLDSQALARSSMVKCIVLNHLIGNGDAHLKNFGVLFEDANQVSLSPVYDCVSTLPYIPGDVPALTLSFDWYSKAWWPRIRIEEFAEKYGLLSHAEIRGMFDEACTAVLEGARSAIQFGKAVAGFDELAHQLEALWIRRVDAFRAEPSRLKSSKVRRGS